MQALISIIFLFSIQLSAAGSNDCQELFFAEHDILDSKSFSLSDYSLKSDYDATPIEFVKEAVAHILDKTQGCESYANSIISNKLQSVSCHELIAGKSYTRSCIAETSLGYFFLNVDMLGSVNLTFNRWD